MAEAIEEANQGVKRTLKDLFGGAVGGVAQVLIGTSGVLSAFVRSETLLFCAKGAEAKFAIAVLGSFSVTAFAMRICDIDLSRLL